ncbi:hypothetical protein PDPE_1-01473 [Photobacterium damselae subsp. piscicida]|uniref:Uncharacterized protein n=1 Tax=Photobacterium damsela subsp. piscicida TaxID=38294 RepID=A0AAD1FLJ4_PHODP|nr:hypothetical protein PDPUS_1_00243 [Photobacterium damselae subsp. piscicida]BBC40633.1 hypothetical protein PDPE_1-01473 [Photobacterium damselae subsp. piscicida]GAW44134.1 hypothetical protein PDPJ_1_01548 [Photobacterium damselae subsp. piscicida]
MAKKATFEAKIKKKGAELLPEISTLSKMRST